MRCYAVSKMLLAAYAAYVADKTNRQDFHRQECNRSICVLSLTRSQVGASPRPFWTAVGLDPILGCLATDNNCCSSDNNLSSRTRVDMIPLFKEIQPSIY